MSRRGRYPKEFKREAVRLLNESDQPVAEISRQLGVKRSLLYRWREEINQKGDKAFEGSGRPTVEEMSEISCLRRELEAVKEERDILKKAAAYFAKDLR